MGTSGNIIDADLIPSNVKNIVDIFGVDGNYGGDIGSSSALIGYFSIA